GIGLDIAAFFRMPGKRRIRQPQSRGWTFDRPACAEDGQLVDRDSVTLWFGDVVLYRSVHCPEGTSIMDVELHSLWPPPRRPRLGAAIPSSRRCRRSASAPSIRTAAVRCTHESFDSPPQIGSCARISKVTSRNRPTNEAESLSRHAATTRRGITLRAYGEASTGRHMPFARYSRRLFRIRIYSSNA